MTLSDIPRNSYPAMRAKTVDKLQEQINRFFGGGKILNFPEGEEGLDAKGDSYKLSRSEIWRCSYGVPIKFEFANSQFFRLQYCQSSSAAILVNRERIPITKDVSCVLPTDRAFAIGDYGPGYQQMTLRILAKSLEEKIVALTGSPVNRALKFDLLVNLATPASQHLRRMTELLVHTLDSLETGFPSLAMAEFEQAMMVAFLCANRNNYSHVLDCQPSDSAPWQVRRAEEYIEANWDRPITVEDIAAITGVSARSIFRAFQQSRNYSPLAFAKQVRLRHARRILNLADATTTVTNVAFACGFSDLGHFSKDYRRMFGESPSQALCRAKGVSSASH
ncbi:MAG TPA: AraC family transcriptional regulator [Steroidobacteraceae bacterium]|nr:AraC family transcriptional regulator [Steroidobacteraceae bacterium]